MVRTRFEAVSFTLCAEVPAVEVELRPMLRHGS